jgi:hypothetical protein
LINDTHFVSAREDSVHEHEPLRTLISIRTLSALRLNETILYLDVPKAAKNLGYLLHNSRWSQATDPRDKVYALLGLCREEDRQIAIDYSKGMQQLVHNVVEHLITTDLNLNILPSDSTTKTSSSNTCSWSFELDNFELGVMWSGYLTTLVALGSVPAQCRMKSNSNELHLRGFEIDIARRVDTAFHNVDGMASAYINTGNFVNEQVAGVWEAFLAVIASYVAITGDKEVIWRTIIMDGDYSTSTLNPVSPPPDSFGIMAGYIFTNALKTELCHVPPDFEPGLPQMDRYLKYITPFISSMSSVSPFRSLFVTREGQVGLGPLGMKSDDIICVLFGGKFLYVSRPTGQFSNSYILVGNAYIYGSTMGELMEPEMRATYEERDFVLV